MEVFHLIGGVLVEVGMAEMEDLIVDTEEAVVVVMARYLKEAIMVEEEDIIVLEIRVVEVDMVYGKN